MSYQLKTLLAIVLSFSLSHGVFASDTQQERKMDIIFEKINKDPDLLMSLIIKIPKGGILHSHLSGAVYAEQLMEIGARKGYCIDRDSLRVTTCKQGGVHMKNLLTPNGTYNIKYNNIIDRWSLRNFLPNKQESIDGHFYQSFYYFLPIIKKNRGELLAILANKAVFQNVQYEELMVSPKIKAAMDVGKNIEWSRDYNKLYKNLNKKKISILEKEISKVLRRSIEEKNRILMCNVISSSACKVKFKYLYQVVRNVSNAELFSELLVGFQVANQDVNVGGVNLVGPEDDPYVMSHYKQQMEMVAYLKKKYPKVKVSLHAGELYQALVPYSGLTNHISGAVNIANADRIGHGVDILFEKNFNQTLKVMSIKSILVEINLTSNYKLLGISPENHPFEIYSQCSMKFGF